MKSATRWMSVSVFAAACTLAASLAQAQSATATSPEVYFCPAASNVYLGNTAPIACSGEACVGGQSTSLTTSQKEFLEAQKGDCRFLDDKEKSLVLPEQKPAV